MIHYTANVCLPKNITHPSQGSSHQNIIFLVYHSEDKDSEQEVMG